MKINIPKGVVAIELSEYLPEMAGQKLFIWVNPPLEKLHAYNALVLDMESESIEQARTTLFPDKPADETGKLSALQKVHAIANRFIVAKKLRKPDSLDQRLLDWYAEIWSQGPAGTGWTAEELRIVEANDPAFLSWAITRTWQARAEHIDRKKKA